MITHSEPSSSIRHLTELHSVLKDDTNPLLPMLTEGGPDDRTNFVYVQLSIISLFLKEDRDMAEAVRTPPSSSWKDLTERVMATLNLGAQAVGLMRTLFPPSSFNRRSAKKMLNNTLYITA